MTATRWYVPAYRAINGAIIPFGHETVHKEYAERDIVAMRDPEDKSAELFLATRIVSDWEPDCHCQACFPNMPFFRVCGLCGDKKCSKVLDHNNECVAEDK